MPDINLTIESEHGPAACIIDCESKTSFCSMSNMASNVITISGLTVTNGICSDSSQGGAAIKATAASPVIRNCIFRNNGELACLLSGGALYFYGGQPLIDQCLFEGNSSGNRGGAIYMETGRLMVRASTFDNNLSQVGEAISVQSVDLQMDDCRFNANHCTWKGGALHTGGPCKVNIADSSFSDNYGGELAFEQSDPAFQAAHKLARVCNPVSPEPSVGSEAHRQILGGAICFGASATQEVYYLDHCRLENNRADAGGAVWSDQNNRLSMTNCIVESNAATGAGGGVYAMRSHSLVQSLQLWNSAFIGNTALTGGAIYQHGGAVFARSNSELWIRYFVRSCTIRLF